MGLRDLLLGLAMALVASGCTSNSDVPLDGVSNGVAGEVCSDFFLVVRDSDASRQSFHVDDFADIVGRYSALSVTASAVNAADFGDLAREAAAAVKATVERYEAGNTDFSAESLVTSLRLDVAQSRMELACAERGYTQYDPLHGDDEPTGSETSSTTTR